MTVTCYYTYYSDMIKRGIQTSKTYLDLLDIYGYVS